MLNTAVSNSTVSNSNDSSSTHSDSYASSNADSASADQQLNHENLASYEAKVLDELNETHQLGFITSDNLRIPTLKILQANGVEFEDAMAVHLNKDTALHSYKTMQYIRILDERMVAAQRQGRLSFYITCTGEEAAVVGSAAALQPTDMIMGQYREQSALRYRGFTTEQFMGQLLGNEMDLGKGR